MVERSINGQERFIEQSNRNHSEIIYMYTSTLNTLATVMRDFLNRNGENPL